MSNEDRPRRTLGRRAAFAAALLVVLAAAVLVPVARVVVHPSSFVPIGDAVTIRRVPGVTAPTRPGKTTGRYLRVKETPSPSVVAAVAAAVDPGRRLRRAIGQSDVPQQQPPNIAALVGMGLSPARMQGVPMPVEVDVDDRLDPTSLAVGLQVFDRMTPQDAAAGRTVLGIGSIAANQALVCTDPDGAEAALQAARSGDIDLVIVPTNCGTVLPGDAGRVIAATTFTEAIHALLDRDGGG